MVELIARTHAQRFDVGRSGAYLLSTSVLISAIAEATAIFRNSFNNLILSTSRIAPNLKGEANVRRQRSRILRCKSVESVSVAAVVTELEFAFHFGGSMARCRSGSRFAGKIDAYSCSTRSLIHRQLLPTAETCDRQSTVSTITIIIADYKCARCTERLVNYNRILCKHLRHITGCTSSRDNGANAMHFELSTENSKERVLRRLLRARNGGNANAFEMKSMTRFDFSCRTLRSFFIPFLPQQSVLAFTL